MPFGLERLALVPMGYGIDVTIWVAKWVAGLPGNVWPTPRLPLAGLVAIALGGLWLSLWQGRWRLWGLVAVGAGFATMLLTRPPNLVIAEGGRFLAARAPDGHYLVAAGPGEKIARSMLAHETGMALRRLARRPGRPAAGARPRRRSLCRYTARGRQVAIVTGQAGLAGSTPLRPVRRDQPGAGAGGLRLPRRGAGRRPHRCRRRLRCGRAVARSRRHRHRDAPTTAAATNAPGSRTPPRTPR